MAIIQSRTSVKALPAPARRVLYIGPAADEICEIVTQHVGEIDIRYESHVSAALEVARQSRFDMVIVDQRDERLATKLIVPLIAGIGYPVKLVVVSSLKDVSQYLSVPGVARVLTSQIREGQFLRVLGLPPRVRHAASAPSHKRSAKPVTAPPQSLDSTLVQGFFNRFMTLVSTLYKRAAFVLLLSLFLAFSFYAVLIGYFLISNSWGAPMTLTHGHELVNKIEGQLTELRVALGKIDQEKTETAMLKVRAARDLEDAQLLVKYSLGTVDKEIKLSARKRKTLASNVKRMTKVRDVLEAQLNKGGMSADLEALYKKRLIDKKTFNASALGLVEASQRLAVLDGDVEDMQSQLENMDANEGMLQSLKVGLETGGPIKSMSSASSELLLLVKQSVDAKAANDIAQSSLKSSATKVKQLSESEAVIKLQIAALESSALARAVRERVDVVFVPYANLDRFQSGTPLYSCFLTVFLCQQSGFVGDAQPGEFNSVHPFFGKPIRGVFVEAKITRPIAATREIIHGTRAPFFF